MDQGHIFHILGAAIASDGGGIGDIIAREVLRGWYIARKDDYYDSMNVSDYLLCGWAAGGNWI
jgi:hypothetical protein